MGTQLGIVSSLLLCVDTLSICLKLVFLTKYDKIWLNAPLPSSRWLLPTSTRSLSSSHAGPDGPWSHSHLPCGRSHSHRFVTPGSSYHCDCTAGGDVPGLTSADRVSTLSAGNRYSHLPQHRPHEHTLLHLLLLCGVSRSRGRLQ